MVAADQDRSETSLYGYRFQHNRFLLYDEGKILFLRDEKALLDRDLAELYGVETRVLNQAVSRNIGRFPDDFMLELSREEIRSISQNVTSSNIKYSKRVHAFTEQGGPGNPFVFNDFKTDR